VRLGRTDSRLRMVAVMLAFLIVAVAAGIRLGYWQVVASDELTAQVEAVFAQNRAKAQRTVRADIVDREGVILAKTTSFDSVVAYPNTMDPDSTDAVIELLGALLDLPASERRAHAETITAEQAQGSRWVRLERQVSKEAGQRVRDAIERGLLPGIDLESVDVRYYPRSGGEPGTSLASHLLGFVSADGTGGEGIERYYDDRLTTVEPGLVDIATVDGQTVRFEDLDAPALELTIDTGLQRQLEKELTIAMDADKAKSVSGLIMDPKSGAIIAAASVPAYDAEDYAQIASEDFSRLRNRVFQDQYEPGSVMKIFTATAALDLGLVTPDTPIRDQRVLRFYDDKVQNADHKARANLNVKKAIAYSRNVATAKLARRLAPTNTQKAARRLFGLWEKVGLTGRTGVDISGEAYGSSYDPRKSRWEPVDLANRAFGQGVSVTLPQLARGIATMVNGGYLVQPHLVADGEQAQVEPKRVISAKTAREAKEILRYVTGGVPWYAQGSLIPGYDIGGKTGTAQIWDTKIDDWKKKRFNHSFAGFVGGRNHEEYVIVVRIEEPVPLFVKQGEIPLQIASYELFRNVASATIHQLGLRKSKDPNAGLTIIGSEAAHDLDPERFRRAKRTRLDDRRTEPRQAKAAAEAGPGGSSTVARDGGTAAAVEPPSDAST
jgi:cell division protein FtsI/penicillin-binding protein 2